MTTAYEPAPLTVPPEWMDAVYGDDDRQVHTACCRPDVALCGQDLTGYTGEPCDGDESCEFCDRISELGLPCGAPLCHIRRTWRGWRSP